MPTVRLGLRENLPQFALLVGINALVGGMIGQERTVLPLLAENVFGLTAVSAMLSFIAVFGVAKAITNLIAGALADRFGRKPVLLAGWAVGLPVPLLLIWAPSWGWVLFANALLGINQGLAWSVTVIMKIDLVGPHRRGTAMGFNEAAGYGAVALAGWATGWIAAAQGLRPEPFYLGLAFAGLGLGVSAALVRETHGHMAHEAGNHAAVQHRTMLDGGQGHEAGYLRAPDGNLGAPHGNLGAPDANLGSGLSFWQVFALATWRGRSLSAVSRAGLVNNLNEGMAWGLFPLFYASRGISLSAIGALVAIAPAVWGLGQLLTGALSDHVGRKRLIAGGQWAQAAGLAVIALGNTFAVWAAGSVLLGAGTAMAYPTLLAAIGDVAHPRWRGAAVGVYRLWRDLGFAVGAVTAGVVADLAGMRAAIVLVAAITAASGADVAVRMTETLRRPHPPGGSR